MGVVHVAGTRPAPPVDAVGGFPSMTWTGWDGSVWDLLGVDDGMFLTGAIRGLGMPEIDQFRSASPAVAGSRWRGHRVTQREVFWPLFVFSDDGAQEWVARDRAFWTTMRPDLPGVWEVTQPSGETRQLSLRFESDGGHSFPHDPSRRGWELYAINLMADDPYWLGDPIVRSWSAGASSAFFPGPPFTISPGHTLATATLDNPGDVQAWPTWVLRGPFTAASVGLDGQVVEVPFALGVGESLVIDTGPRAQTAITDAGVDRTGDLGTVGFVPVPAGQAVPLEIELTGAGSITASLVPRFYRAW